MKLDALTAELERQEAETTSFRVRFELREDGLLKSDMVPDRTEPALNLTACQQLATRMARMDPRGERYVNIYLIRAHDFTPVGTQQWNVYPPPLPAHGTSELRHG